MCRLFAYGTLRVPHIVRAVLGRHPPASRAVLHGYFRRKMREEVYPGIAPRQDAQVEGLVYELTGPQELQLLDAYEGSLYERADVHLETAKGTMSAMAYVVRPDFLTHLSEEEWSLSVFIRKHAHRFRVDWE